MKRFFIPMLLVALGGSCGDGKWGAELQLALGSTDASGAPLSAGDTLALSGGEWSLTLDRACLAVELARFTPAGAADVGGEDCFCHGDPPECHGDCSATSPGTPSAALEAELDAVVDLLSGPSPVVTRGAAPGDYNTLSLVLGGEHAAQIPTTCADLNGATFLLRGTLTHTATAATWALNVDLRAETVTEPISALPVATATTETPAVLLAELQLDRVLEHLDLAALTADASGTLTIGGDDNEHPEAADELLHGLSHAESYVAAGQVTE